MAIDKSILKPPQKPYLDEEYLRQLARSIDLLVDELYDIEKKQDAFDGTGAFGYLSSSTPITITSAGTFYTIQTFTIPVVQNFEPSSTYTGGLKYTGEETLFFEIDWHTSIYTDANNTTVTIGISKNGTIQSFSEMIQYCKTTPEIYTLSGTGVFDLETGDEVVFSVTSDGTGGIVTFEKFTATIRPFLRASQ